MVTQIIAAAWEAVDGFNVVTAASNGSSGN